MEETQEVQTEADFKVVQERNSGGRKGFYYNYKAGGYVPAKPKEVNKTSGNGNKIKLWLSENGKPLLIFAVIVAVVAFIAYKRSRKPKLDKVTREADHE